VLSANSSFILIAKSKMGSFGLSPRSGKTFNTENVDNLLSL